MNGDIVRIRKVMKTSLIKDRIRGDSNKYYDWYNKQIRVELQIYKVLYIPELLREYIFKKAIADFI